jgi:four helix bundle protein
MSGEIRGYRDLAAWQCAKELGLAIYSLTRSFPEDERFGLISQLRRGGVSVASNIAEGYGRGAAPDYARFLRIARGALFEIETQIEFALDLGYITGVEHERMQGLIDSTARPLSGLLRSIEKH